MFSQSADRPAPDQTPAPVGMRELPPQPPKPVMPAYTLTPPDRTVGEASLASDESVVAKDDHFDGTFTSRGTVRVFGSVKGRIEAVRLRIEEGGHVDADVIVDEAIVAGEFSGNLTCRDRLEARPSGRISGRVETLKLMLHEGAKVEGEMHMLSEPVADPSETIRGTAPIRGMATGSGIRSAGASTTVVTSDPVVPQVAPAPRTGVSAAVSTTTPEALSTATARAVMAQLAARPDASVNAQPSTTPVRVTPRATSSAGTGNLERNGNGSSSGF